MHGGWVRFGSAYQPCTLRTPAPWQTALHNPPTSHNHHHSLDRPVGLCCGGFGVWPLLPAPSEVADASQDTNTTLGCEEGGLAPSARLLCPNIDPKASHPPAGLYCSMPGLRIRAAGMRSSRRSSRRSCRHNSMRRSRRSNRCSNRHCCKHVCRSLRRCHPRAATLL